MRKINIGAGPNWYKEGWEVLDNGSSDYSPSWKHKGKCWDSKLPDETFDVVYTHHMLEHVPHFRMEKTIAEFNRIMKNGGTLRIVVPNLRNAVMAYINNDESYFSGSRHYSNHMGIGAMFVQTIISPGKQTIALSREMDEVFGGYAHLYAYDFEMLKTLLEKWGFMDVIESEPIGSFLEELQEAQHFICTGNPYDLDDEFVKNKEYLKQEGEWYFTGFDSKARKSLCVEAKKVRNERYAFDKEFDFNKNSRFDNPVDKLKLTFIRLIVRTLDFTYSIFIKSGLRKIYNLIR
jgi:predicted SAM-dependent methyltransferase